MPTTEQRLVALEVFAKGGTYVPPTDTLPPPVVTPAPAGLHLATTAPGEAALQWQLVPDVSGYDAMYSGAGLDSPVRETTTPSISWQGLAPGSYTFAVRAKSAAGVSDWARVTGDVQGVPTPTPPGPTPTPGLYAEIGGIPADAKLVTGSADLSTLSGNVQLDSHGTFTATGDVRANLYAATSGLVIMVPAGKQVTIYGKVAGLTFDGKGKGGAAADDDNANAMVLVEDGAKLHTVRFTGSQGVGCSIIGKGVKSWDCEFDHNGAQGRGGKSKGDGSEGSGYTETDAKLHDNNKVLRKSNAGNKITRCTDWLLVRPHYYDECGPGQWLDNYNERIKLVDPVFERGTKDKKDYEPCAFRTELGLPGGVELVRPVFIDIPSSCLSIDESSNVRVTDPTFGKCKYAAELRNMLRGDDATGKLKNGKPVDEKAFTCRLYNVSIEGDVKVSPDTGPVVASPASNAKVTLSNNKLSFAPPLKVLIGA